MFAGGGSHVMDNDRGETLSRPLIWGGADGATITRKNVLTNKYNFLPYTIIESLDPRMFCTSLDARPPNAEGVLLLQ